MKTRIVFLVWVCISMLFTGSMASAQPNDTVAGNRYYQYLKRIFQYRAINMMHNQLVFTLPAGFEISKLKKPEYLTFLKSPKYDFVEFHYEYFALKSSDKDFITLIDATFPYISNDGVYLFLNLSDPDDLKIEIDIQHLGQLGRDCHYNTGDEEASDDWPVRYESSEYARRAFNADTVMTYPLKMWKNYKRKYSNCQVTIIQKNGRAFVRLLTLYKDNAKDKLTDYMKKLEGMFWFRNPEDFLEYTKEKVSLEGVVIKAKGRSRKKTLIR